MPDPRHPFRFDPAGPFLTLPGTDHGRSPASADPGRPADVPDNRPDREPTRPSLRDRSP